MSQGIAIIRERIQAQGFCGLDDKTCAEINYPLRMAPAICMLWAATGTALGSPTILWMLAPLAALGAILPGHPFDIFYNSGLRHLLGTPALPRYGKRRRSGCVMATILISTAAWGFQTGRPIVGNIFGWLPVFGTFVNVSTGICIPALVLQAIFGKVDCD